MRLNGKWGIIGMINHFEKISKNECVKRLNKIQSLSFWVGEIIENKDVDVVVKELKNGLRGKKSMRLILIKE